MPDNFHSEKSHTESQNAGCCKKYDQAFSKSGSGTEFPKIKLTFSLSGFLLLFIWGYKKCISPLLPPCCRFTPTCSVYAAEAIMIHGPFKGSVLAIWRLMRCQPFCKGGYDPVPPVKQKEKKEGKL